MPMNRNTTARSIDRQLLQVLLLRLRQACVHPFLAQTKSGGASGDDPADDPAKLEAEALGKAPLPDQHNPATLISQPPVAVACKPEQQNQCTDPGPRPQLMAAYPHLLQLIEILSHRIAVSGTCQDTCQDPWRLAEAMLLAVDLNPGTQRQPAAS